MGKSLRQKKKCRQSTITCQPPRRVFYSRRMEGRTSMTPNQSIPSIHSNPSSILNPNLQGESIHDDICWRIDNTVSVKPAFNDGDLSNVTLLMTHMRAARAYKT